ncbi:DUF6434 domain-containing protein [Phytopseudomonas punonensis]|uniref:DUF6434 domain-containing protein n=1 Tax=Phytopseudomonas punonensis TaxID=1220495 RepID=A0A1M7KA71_9GAMM|nr:DUF6434 domain-containing protein [Pseudomonas punonensis]SHM62124.1 hypothetical protein SAMN05216288_4001 [Pseudomonas punonensis]
MAFDWHGGTITRDTPVSNDYRNTRKVRRFMTEQCGVDFRFDRPFMAWIRSGAPRTMGDVVDEWLRRNGAQA